MTAEPDPAARRLLRTLTRTRSGTVSLPPCPLRSLLESLADIGHFDRAQAGPVTIFVITAKGKARWA